MKATLRMSASLKASWVIALAKMKMAGSTRPQSAMMPYGSGSSMTFVISKPVRSSTENSAPRVCAAMVRALGFQAVDSFSG